MNVNCQLSCKICTPSYVNSKLFFVVRGSSFSFPFFPFQLRNLFDGTNQLIDLYARMHGRVAFDGPRLKLWLFDGCYLEWWQ